jgi:SAM-dependent methyltransferase
MSDQVLLPRTTFRPSSPLGRRRPARTLNPIMEEPEQTRDSFIERRRNRRSIDKIEQWLSPMSDHFPTPRGQHFLAAPVFTTSSSCASSDAEPEPELDNDDASSQASSSNPSLQWNNTNSRDSIMTDVTEFDDLYDVSDDETTRKQRLQASGISRQRSSRSFRRTSRASMEMRRSLTPLVIPEEATATAAKKLMSPIPPTPPSAVLMSPALKSFMELRQSQDIPRVSAPPSLDGSIGSEEMAQMSAPPTPLIGARDNEDEEWSGVRLQPGALETLQALSGSDSEYEDEPTQVIEVPQEMTESRQRLPRLVTGAGVARAPSHRHSLADLTRLDIPSPGGFFSDLSSASRRTWNNSQPEEANPPTSTTAENFYKIPWGRTMDRIPPPPPRPLHLDDLPSAIVERVIECPVNEYSGDLPTAIRVEETPVPITAVRIPRTPKQPEAPASETAVEEPSSPVDVNEIIAEYDTEYITKQEENAISHINRTQMWLAAQRSYLQGIVGFSEENEASEDSDHESEPEEKPEVPSVVASPEIEQTEPKKKAVRFSEVVVKQDIPCSLPSKILRQESSYYRAFTDYTVRACASDVFIHRQPRFEALQAQRVCLRDAHRNQLLGKFQLSVVPQSAKKRMSTNVVRGDDVVHDDPEKLRADKEAEALSQMHLSTWQVAATKLLNGGRLISAPVGKRLARQSYMAVSPDGLSRDRARILDLGGQGACDWAWHAALQYPNTKIYTVTTKSIRQLSNSNIRGPPNHRQVAVTTLSKLPFDDDQFDLISARELHAVLKISGENGADEWDACLRECMRVLKPGGYIEFGLLDADIVNAGPLGNAKAVEFSFALQTLGYDPNPTRSFLGRLATAGFDEVRRAWVCLPVGPKRPPRPVAAATTTSARDSTSGASVHVHQLEAMVSGSAENAAAVTGVAAGWSWERWLLRAETEKAAGELRLADTVTPGKAMHEAGKMIADVHAVVEEGRQIGSCFRTLRGYARKPRAIPSIPAADAPAVPTIVRSTVAVEAPVMDAAELDRSGSIRIFLDTESLMG